LSLSDTSAGSGAETMMVQEVFVVVFSYDICLIY
jgi:hypothetical protein